MKRRLIATIKLILALLILTIWMTVLFSWGASRVQLGDAAGQLTPQEAAQSGLALLVVCLVDTLLFAAFIRRSWLHGWRLMLVTAILYYGVKTFQANIEAWYFMTNLTAAMIPGLFQMTLPAALLWPPAAVWLLGKARRPAQPPSAADRPLPPQTVRTWTWKLALAGFVFYPLLFFTFGYFVAWQDPAVRAFYGGGELIGFFPHMAGMLTSDPKVLLFEMLRGLLWASLAGLFLWASAGKRWAAALLLALIFALVENNVHLMPNPLMPAAVRQAHFIETASSNFIYALLTAWLLTWQKT